MSRRVIGDERRREMENCASMLVEIAGLGEWEGCVFFFFQAEDGIRDYRVTGVQPCALPICTRAPCRSERAWTRRHRASSSAMWPARRPTPCAGAAAPTTTDRGAAAPRPSPFPAFSPCPCPVDRKSTRLNSSHLVISYAVFCLKKKNTK